jgi:hypothetical protein
MKKERKLKFLGDSSDYNWELSPVYGQIYTESDIRRMYGKGWSRYGRSIDTFLESDKGSNHCDFEEVFDESDKLINEKEPNSFYIILQWEDISHMSRCYPIEDFDHITSDVEEILNDKTCMVLETPERQIIIPHFLLKKCIVKFYKLWRE